MKVLHLNLLKKWYEMIENGEKTEEYRSITPYWTVRLRELDVIKLTYRSIQYDAICFHFGYTNRTMMFEHLGTRIDVGHAEWGATPDMLYYVISIGKRLDREEKQ